jgi:hypothetical protein
VCKQYITRVITWRSDVLINNYESAPPIHASFTTPLAVVPTAFADFFNYVPWLKITFVWVVHCAPHATNNHHSIFCWNIMVSCSSPCWCYCRQQRAQSGDLSRHLEHDRDLHTHEKKLSVVCLVYSTLTTMIQQKAGQIYNTVIKMLWSMHVEQQEETKTHRTKSQSSNVCVCVLEGAV